MVPALIDLEDRVLGTEMSSILDDARERAELGFGVDETKHAEAWRGWPDIYNFHDGDLAPWWYAGISYIHEILPAEAAEAAAQFPTPVHLEAHLFSRVQELAEEVYANKLQRYQTELWDPPGAALDGFKKFAISESVALIGTLKSRLGIPARSATESTLSDRKAARAAAASRVRQNLARLRLNSGWSFDDLANKSGVNKKLLIRCEIHGKGMYPANKKKIADAFGVTVAELEK